MMTRKSELEESGVWQTRKKKKDRSLASSKKKNLHTYTHIRIERYIQVGTMRRRPGASQALGREGGQKGGKLRAKFFVKCPDGSEEVR
jgi:hypothetical protein